MYSLLKGVRVLDFTKLIPGAYATAKLADLGADVIKLEQPPAGDYLRSVPPLKDGVGLLHLALNRNKRSVLLDLSSPEGQEQFAKLVGTADVFIEGGRPGAAARAGADYESLRKIKPDIIYCSISGYGQNGPYSGLPSHGANMDAAAGYVDVQPRDDGTSTVPNIRVFTASQSGGLHAALGIAAALHKRHTTGEGSYLDVGCWDSAVSWMYGNLTCLMNTGELFPGSERMGPKYGCYQTSDSRWIVVALLEPKFWHRFCEESGRADLTSNVDEESLTDFGSESLRGEIGDHIRTRTQKEWLEFAVEHQLPIAPVLSPKELLDNEHVAVREMLTDAPHPRSGERIGLVALPIKVGGETFEVRLPAPEIGQQTDEILSEIS